MRQAVTDRTRSVWADASRLTSGRSTPLLRMATAQGANMASANSASHASARSPSGPLCPTRAHSGSSEPVLCHNFRAASNPRSPMKRPPSTES